MNELTTEKTVTTKELAESLGVDISTVKKTVKRLEDSGEVLHHSTIVKGNTVFLYNEKQATLIKQEIQKHHNLQSRQIDSVSTELEENEIIINAMNLLLKRKKELEALNAEKDQKLLEQKPKVEYFDSLVDKKHLTNIRNTAKELNVKEHIFVNFLIANRYLYRDSKKVLLPTSVHKDCFEVKDWTKENGQSGVQTFVTVEGKRQLLKLFQLTK